METEIDVLIVGKTYSAKSGFKKINAEMPCDKAEESRAEKSYSSTQVFSPILVLSLGPSALLPTWGMASAGRLSSAGQ